MRPVDDREIPPAQGVDPDYLTRDLMSRLERAAYARVRRYAVRHHVPLREAAVKIAEELEES